jgi:hypothetical protein
MKITDTEKKPRTSGPNTDTSRVVFSFAGISAMMLIMVLSLLVAGVLAVFVYVRAKTSSMMKLSEKIPGPKLVPVLGNALELGLKTKGW